MPTRDATTLLPALEARQDDLVIWRTLQSAGAVLLTGAASTPDAFDALTERFATRFRIHQDPSRPRYNAADTTQGVAGGSDAIALHAERAYLPGRPELLFFCCITPSTTGGATTVCDGAAVFSALDSLDARALAELSLVWRTSLPAVMWQRMWNTERPEEASRQLTDSLLRNEEAERATHWFEGETMYVEYESCGIERGWIGGRPSFASYLLLAAADAEGEGPRARQRDGRAVPPDLLARLAATSDTHTIDIAWAHGDVVLIDNTRFMHGRRAFSGGDRRILVRMGDVLPHFRATAGLSS